MAGVSSFSEGAGPRLNDFGSTFAGNRITDWIRNKVDLNRMLPALAVHMGYSSLAATEHYLKKRPEQFRKQLSLLSFNEGRRRSDR